MRILITTQKVDKNDAILGFFHRWLLEFATQFDEVTVICLQEGEHELPDNVRVYSLGKERGSSVLKKLFLFYKHIFLFRKSYDSVFVHMNPEYLILGGFLWRLWGKKVGLWYLHRSVDVKLRIAEKFAHMIFSASKESFRLKSRKLKIVGHGIDTETFSPTDRVLSDEVRLLHVGRVTKIKQIDKMLLVLKALREKKNASLTIVGEPVTKKDVEYQKELEDEIHKMGLEDSVVFVGSVENTEVVRYYRSHDVFLNFSNTGSIDKTVLEALATEINVVTTNEAFKEILPVGFLSEFDMDSVLSVVGGEWSSYREYVVRNHNLSLLIEKIKKVYI